MAPVGRRYSYLAKHYVYTALNNLRASFLAAKNGEEVDLIIDGIFTYDEKLKIGRRIEIARHLIAGATYEFISEKLLVGIQTISKVAEKLEENPNCFSLINNRLDKVEREFRSKAYEKVGGPKLVYKKTKYTGFRRKDVKR